MRRLAFSALAFSLLALLAACASGTRRTDRGASAASAGGQTSAQAAKARDAKREMTWDEYYADVEQRARRAGGFVMWFNPPRPIRRPLPAVPGSEIPGGPSSLPAR